MTPKGQGVIRGRCNLLYDPKVTVTFVVALTKVMTQTVIRSLEIAVTYFMTPKITVTFEVGLT